MRGAVGRTHIPGECQSCWKGFPQPFMLFPVCQGGRDWQVESGTVNLVGLKLKISGIMLNLRQKSKNNITEIMPAEPKCHVDYMKDWPISQSLALFSFLHTVSMRCSCLLEAGRDRFGEIFNLCVTRKLVLITQQIPVKVAEKQDIYTEKIMYRHE